MGIFSLAVRFRGYQPAGPPRKPFRPPFRRREGDRSVTHDGSMGRTVYCTIHERLIFMDVNIPVTRILWL